MKFLSRVVWSEGMHLGPHHFQTQSRYFEDTLWFLHASLRQNPWGFLNYSLEIANGNAILAAASGILPDGLIFDIPDSDSVPPPVSLATLFTPTDTFVTLYLSIRAREDAGMDLDLSGGSEARYAPVQRTLRDETLGLDEHIVSLASKNLALCSEAQLPPHAVAFPIARILRDGKGGFVSDPDFIPPALRIGASPSLMSLLRRLVEAIEDKVAAVQRDKRNSGQLELGTSALDVANYWFLHCLCSAAPLLRNHLLARRSHPEEVYRDLARLAGSLSTFSLEATLGDIPRYSHEDLATTFGQLDVLIRRYLEIVVPSNSIALDFRKSDYPFVYQADVKDERCLRRARWIFGIRSSLGDSALLRQVPHLVKVCSRRGVPTLVKRAIPGLELLHLPIPPSAMHAQADMQYFSISLEGICWEDIQNTKQVGVYIPAEIGDAVFDLTVITETNA